MATGIYFDAVEVQEVDDWELIEETDTRPTQEELRAETRKRNVKRLKGGLNEIAKMVVANSVTKTVELQVAKAVVVSIGSFVTPLAPVATGVTCLASVAQLGHLTKGAFAARFWYNNSN